MWSYFRGWSSGPLPLHSPILPSQVKKVMFTRLGLASCQKMPIYFYNSYKLALSTSDLFVQKSHNFFSESFSKLRKQNSEKTQVQEKSRSARSWRTENETVRGRDERDNYAKRQTLLRSLISKSFLIHESAYASMYYIHMDWRSTVIQVSINIYIETKSSQLNGNLNTRPLRECFCERKNTCWRQRKPLQTAPSLCV